MYCHLFFILWEKDERERWETGAKVNQANTSPPPDLEAQGAAQWKNPHQLESQGAASQKKPASWKSQGAVRPKETPDMGQGQRACAKLASEREPWAKTKSQGGLSPKD